MYRSLILTTIVLSLTLAPLSVVQAQDISPEDIISTTIMIYNIMDDTTYFELPGNMGFVLKEVYADFHSDKHQIYITQDEETKAILTNNGGAFNHQLSFKSNLGIVFPKGSKAGFTIWGSGGSYTYATIIGYRY